MSEPISVTLPLSGRTKGAVLFKTDQNNWKDLPISNVYVRKEHVPSTAKAIKVTVEFE